MAATYTPIASITLGANASSVTFSSIPQTYTDLVMVINGTASAGINTQTQVGNNSVDTGSNYSETNINGNGSAAGSSRDTSLTFSILFNSYTGQGSHILHFMNYANTTTYKTMLSRSDTASDLTSLWVSLWRSTAAINIIKIGAGAQTFSSGMTFNLYGILGANA
jgi:hypothetical protein